MTPRLSRVRGGDSAVVRRGRISACVCLGATLLAVSAVKFAAGGGRVHGGGLAALIQADTVRWISAGIEALLGLGLLSPVRRLAAVGAFYWTTMLVGLMAAMVLQGIPLSACGCFGVLSASSVGHFAIAAGMGLLAWTGSAMPSTDESSGRPPAAFADR